MSEIFLVALNVNIILKLSDITLYALKEPTKALF